MATAYTSLLGLALPVTGELSGTWGDTANDQITALLDSAVAGTTTITSDADVTLTTTTGAANTSRQAILLCSGARTVLRTITAPAQSKIYTIINATTGGFSVKLVGVGPTTGVTIIAGESAVCAWNGSDFIKTSSTIANAAGSNTQVQFNNSGVLGGSASLVWDGTFLTAGSIKNSALTNTRLTFAGASGLLSDSANLTFNGTSLAVTGTVAVTGALTATLDSTFAGAITPSQTAGIVGTTTNNNANAGSVGEVVSSSVAVGSAVSLTNATGAFTGKTITSISLTAGDWDVFGSVGINMAATTNFTASAGGINTVADTLNSAYEEETRFTYGAAGFVPANVFSFAFPTTRVSIASTTTYYLIGYASFSISTATAFGRITARRRR